MYHNHDQESLRRSVPGHLCALPHRWRGKSCHGLISFPSSLSSYGSFRFCGGSHFLSLRFPHPVLQSFPYAGIVKELCNISSGLFQPLSVTAQDRCERKDFYCNLFVIFTSAGEKFRPLYPTSFKFFYISHKDLAKNLAKKLCFFTGHSSADMLVYLQENRTAEARTCCSDVITGKGHTK